MAKSAGEINPALFDFAGELAKVVNVADLHGKRIWITSIQLQEGNGGVWYEVMASMDDTAENIQINANMKTWVGKTADRIVTDQLPLPLCFDVQPYGKYSKLAYVPTA